MRATRRLRADLALIGNTLVWGTSFVIVKQAIQGVSPLLFLALRFSLATAALLLLYRAELRSQWRRPGAIRAGIIVGCFLFCGFAFQTFGLRLTSPAKSGFLTGLSIPAVPLVSALVYRIRPRVTEIAGVVCATAGLALLTLQGEALGIRRGDLLTLVCALSFAAHIVILGHYGGAVAFEMLAVMQVGTAAVLSLASFWWFEPPFIELRAGMLAAVAFTGLAATAVAFTVQAWAQQYTTATRTALIYALEPVFAWVTSFIVIGERLSVRAVFGALLILAGILLVEIKGPLKPTGAEAHPST
jgi:drug/metabolite transporter (DMT)-like permease